MNINEFIENRKNSQFDQSIFDLLSPVAENVVSFESLLEDVILPVFVENNTISSESELLNEFLGNLKQAWNNWRQGSTPPANQTNDAQANQKYQDMLAKNRQGAGFKSPNEMNADRITGPINQTISQLINQDLVPVIDVISQKLKTQAYQKNNRNLSLAADIFKKSLTNAAQRFKVKANGRMPEDQLATSRADFRKGRSDYHTQDLRNRYSQLSPKDIELKRNYVQGLEPDGNIPLASKVEPNRYAMSPADRQRIMDDPRTQRRLNQSRLRTGFHNRPSGMRSVA